MKSPLNLRNDFISALGITLQPRQIDALLAYADLVWEKQTLLNLTSVKDKQEIWDRHILDGITCAALINKIAAKQSKEEPLKIADFGAGAGYIGVVLQITLGARAEITLVESLERRCNFLEWAMLKLASFEEGFKRARVLRLRAQSGNLEPVFDFTTERAMGALSDVLPVCCAALKAGGFFIAYQTSAQDILTQGSALKAACAEQREDFSYSYSLPSDDKGRKLVVFMKDKIC